MPLSHRSKWAKAAGRTKALTDKQTTEAQISRVIRDLERTRHATTAVGRGEATAAAANAVDLLRDLQRRMTLARQALGA